MYIYICLTTSGTTPGHCLHHGIVSESRLSFVGGSFANGIPLVLKETNLMQRKQ